MKRTICIAFTVLFFVSCEKDELPVPAHNPGNVITATVNMEANYKWQLYYDLGTNTLVGQNLKTSWDLGFEATSDGYRIITNTSKAMFAYNTGSTVFENVNDTIGMGVNKTWDMPSGNLDSTAIGNWTSNNNVYIIDRGYNELGIHQGFRKIKFLSVNNDMYSVRFANLNGSGDTIFQIEKDSTYNFMFLSLGGAGKIVTVEPPKKNWDLCFTQYLHVFYDPLQTYLVTGCLLNKYETTAAIDSVKTFSSILYADVNGYTFSFNRNKIGYDWKTFAGGTYTTNTNINYVIKDSEGFYYKLHFIDFYNTAGVKGNPIWEHQRL